MYFIQSNRSKRALVVLLLAKKYVDIGDFEHV